MIEKIQMRATEMIEGMSYIEYGERLKLLRLPTLSYGRARGGMIEVWKHYHVYDPKVIAPTFQRARTRRKMYQIQRLHPGGPIMLLLVYSPSLNSGVGYYQYIQESFGQPLGRSSTEVQLPRNHTKCMP